MMVEIEELNDVGASDGESSLTLVFKDGDTRYGEVEGGFEFRGFESPAEKNVEFSSHDGLFVLIGD